MNAQRHAAERAGPESPGMHGHGGHDFDDHHEAIADEQEAWREMRAALGLFNNARCVPAAGLARPGPSQVHTYNTYNIYV